MMASEKLQIPVEVSGSEDATRKLATVSDAIDEMKTSATQADAAVGELGQEQGKLNDKIADTAAKLRESNRQQQEAANRLQQSTLRTIDFTTKLSGAANAVQSLSAQLGAQGGVAGLVGSLTGAAAAGAQMGAVFGPSGAIVGGIVGAVIPAVGLLVQSTENANASVNALVESVVSSQRKLADFLQTVQQAAGTAAMSGRVESGTGSAAEQQAFIAQQQAAIDRINAAIRGASATAADSGTSTTTRFQAQELVERLRTTLAQEERELARRRRIYEESARETDEILMEDLQQSAQRANTVLVGRVHAAGRAVAEQLNAAHAAQQRALEALMERAGTKDLNALVTGAATEARTTNAANRNRAFEGMERQKSVQEAEAEKVAEGLRVRLEAEQALRDAQQARIDEIQERERAALEATSKAWEALGSDFANKGASLAGSLGGAFSDAFQLAIQGQADFGKAFEQSMKKILMQYGTQLTIEGVAALFTAIGSSVMNQPNAAVKYAEGFGKIGLGISLGAAGAAIPSGASAGAQPERPREAAPRGDSEGGGNVVINWNSPTFTAATHQQLGREINASVRAASSRFGRAA